MRVLIVLASAVAAAVAATTVISTVRATGPGPALPVTAVSASHDDGNVAPNTIDGKPSTRWSDEGDGVWLELDLGDVRTVTSVAISWYKGDQRHADFAVQVSTTGHGSGSLTEEPSGSLTENRSASPTSSPTKDPSGSPSDDPSGSPTDDPSGWTTVVDRRKASGKSTKPESYPFAARPARYVRVLGYGNEDNNWTSISEIAAYGEGGGPAPSASDGSGGPAPSAPGRCSNPGDVLDLTDWELTLPTGPPENPEDVYQPQLRSFTVDPWFVPTADCTGVSFRAAVDGVTTSGSANPRSELREMMNGGKDKAAWSSGSGTHTMVISEAITHLPEQRPYVVAGQIHDSADDVQVFRLEGSNLYLTDGNTTHYKLITDSYKLGTRFEARFVVSGGSIQAYYNGTLVSTLAKSFSGAYFKAGAYTQANCGNAPPCSAGNYGEVTIFSVKVSHS